jgi:hypothetical protein
VSCVSSFQYFWKIIYYLEDGIEYGGGRVVLCNLCNIINELLDTANAAHAFVFRPVFIAADLR